MKLLNKLPKEHIFQESDSVTCGPCCLTMIYALKRKKVSFKEIMQDFHQTGKGQPTYPEQLARHLLKNGLTAKLIFSNSQVLSPAWKDLPNEEIIENLKEWLPLHPKHQWFFDVLYTLFFLQEGGSVQQESYTVQTIKSLLDQGYLIITGVDEDWIWEHRFKIAGNKRVIDEIEGEVEGHYVVITGYTDQNFNILDPFPTQIEGKHGSYGINQHQLLNASLFWGSTLIIAK